MNTCGYSPHVTSSLTRGWICRLQLLMPSPAQSFSGPSLARRITTFYCLRFEVPPTWRPRSPHLHLPGTGWPGYPPGTIGRLLRLAELRLRYSTPPPRGIRFTEQTTYTRYLTKWCLTFSSVKLLTGHRNSIQCGMHSLVANCHKIVLPCYSQIYHRYLPHEKTLKI
jgi:hypothetical protein